MIVECISIFSIIFAIMVIFLRTNRDHAIETIPLLILPGVNILDYLFSETLSTLIPVNPFMMYVILNIIAVIVSSVFVWIFSRRFKRKNTRISYLAMCIIFNVILASILIKNS